MKNILLLVDTKNLFNSLHRTFNSGKLDYLQYRELIIANTTDHIYNSIAYGQVSDNHNFQTFLSKLGFNCRFKPVIKNYFPNHNIQIALDTVQQLSSGKIDRVVIGSSDPELVDLITYIREQGQSCDIYASRIPRVLKDVANNFYELDGSILLRNSNSSVIIDDSSVIN